MPNTRLEDLYDQWRRLESERIGITEGESDDPSPEQRYELIVSQQERLKAAIGPTLFSQYQKGGPVIGTRSTAAFGFDSSRF